MSSESSFLGPRGNPSGQQIYSRTLWSRIEIQFNPIYQDLPLACLHGPPCSFLQVKNENSSFSPSVQAIVNLPLDLRPRVHEITKSDHFCTAAVRLGYWESIHHGWPFLVKTKNTSTSPLDSPVPGPTRSWMPLKCCILWLQLNFAECWWALCLDCRHHIDTYTDVDITIYPWWMQIGMPEDVDLCVWIYINWQIFE